MLGGIQAQTIASLGKPQRSYTAAIAKPCSVCEFDTYNRLTIDRAIICRPCDLETLENA
jgi:hypothetical protein